MTYNAFEEDDSERLSLRSAIGQHERPNKSLKDLDESGLNALLHEFDSAFELEADT